MIETFGYYIDGLVGHQDEIGASIRCAFFIIVLLSPIMVAMMWPKRIEKLLLCIGKKVLRFLAAIVVFWVPPVLFFHCVLLPLVKLLNNYMGSHGAIIYRMAHVLFLIIFCVCNALMVGFWCRKKYHKKGNHFQMRKDENMLSHDAAICLWRQDFLGREPIVNAVVGAILRANVCKEAEYIGIFGAWGSGKTSVMNLAKREMTIKGKDSSLPAIFVDFQAWSFSNSTDAIAGFLRMVIQALQRKGEEKTAKAFKALAQMHSLRRINLKGGLTGDILETARQWFFATMYNERRTFQRVRIALRAMKPRLVVVVDDLERTPSHDVGTIIAFLMANFNFPNTVIVFLSDRNHLAQSLALYLERGKRKGCAEDFGREYLEKIITHYIELPGFDETNVWRHVIVELKKLLSYEDCWNYDIDTDDGDNYETVRSYVKTTRDANLFLSKVWCGMVVHKNATRTATLNLHIGDFLALTAIRIWAPDLYSNLKTMIEDLIKRWKNHILSLDWGMPESEYEEWLKKCVPDETGRAIARVFLGKRVGIVKSNNNNALYILSGIGDVDTRLSYRLASPNYYRLYFEDFSDLQYIPKEILSSFISSISTRIVPYELLKQVKGNGQLKEFIRTIEGLNEFEDSDSTITYFETLMWLANQSYDVSYFGWQQGELDYNGPFLYDVYVAIGRCILRYVRKWDGKRYANGLARGVVEADGDIASAGSLLLKASKSVPSCFLIWQFLSWDHERQDNTKLLYAGQLFAHSDYEEFVDLYLDNIELLQHEDNVFGSYAFFDLMRGWNISLLRRNDKERYRRMRCAILPALSKIENVIKLKPLYERSVVRYGDGVVINGKSFLGVDVNFCLKFFGMILSRKIAKMLSSALSLPTEMRMIAYAFCFAVKHNMNENVCSFEAQVEYVRKTLASKN